MVIKVFFAKWFAIFAHWSIRHKRKYTHEPYWVHLEEVYNLLLTVNHTNDQLAAAWLHDTVEDTWVRHWMIRSLFGKEIALLVKELTDITTLADGNRKKRKTIKKAIALLVNELADNTILPAGDNKKRKVTKKAIALLVEKLDSATIRAVESKKKR